MGKKVDHKSDQLCEYTYEQIKQITNNFNKAQLLGTGGFGTVYKGICEDKRVIAVKVLKNTTAIDSKDFQNEFENLSRFKHQNVVELVGFCNESHKVEAEFEGNPVIAEEIHRVLCFEYVCNGDLTKYISADECSGHNWQFRYRIIKGVCDGLQFLRHGLLWHLDLKPDNILLDENMIPKIADFGLSRLVCDESTRKTMNVSGTRGYMPPEYIERGILSEKSDIFSLGVIVAKIVAGHECYSKFADVEGNIFIKHVHDNWKKRLCKILTPKPLQVYCEQVTKCIQIAVQCLKRDRKERPSIESIVSDLRAIEIKISNLGLQKEQCWDEESILLEEGIIAVPPEMAADKGVLSTLPKKFPLDFLKTITDQFSNKQIISQNAVGILYKGILPDGKVIMVNKLVENAPLACDRAFSNEVQNLMSLQNENVIQLLGYCYEGQKKVAQNNGRYIVVDVFEALLCYEYLPKGSLKKNLFEVPGKMDWGTRFKVIKGICQGLLFLHRIGIVHMDLKPENILLDNNMRPKIAYFGLSRLFGEEQTHMHTQNVVGSCGYLAPEYVYRGEISTKLDIYSLGLLILETTTGERNIPEQNELAGWEFIENVRQKWTLEHIAWEYSFLDSDDLRQVKTCIKIGLQCMVIGRYRRPSIGQILDMLDRLPQIDSDSFLSLQPQRINFPIKPKRLTSSSLYLINRTDDRIAFRISTQIPKKYRTKLPFYGIVLPKCTYTLNVITPEQRKAPPSDNDNSLTLQSSKALHDHEDLDNVDPASVAVFLDTAGDEVQETKIVVACEPLTETVSNQIIDGQNYREVLSVDVHPTEPWILTSNKKGYVCIWNYQTQAEMEYTEVTREPVYSVKFIVREECFVVGSGNGSIYVFDYNTMEEVDEIEAHDGHGIMCLAVNPTYSYVLSASDDRTIKLWDWTKEWQCTRTFEGHEDTVTQVMFDPRNCRSFASASLDHTIKIWNIHSATCHITLDGHQDGLLCVHYHPRYVHRYLISGSSDGAAKIWDLDTDSCVTTLQEHAEGLSALCWHPELWLLVTGSLDGTVRIWNLNYTTNTYRLENIIALNLGAVHALGYLNGLTRIVVGCDQGIALMDINVV
ncbi:hypothetical protein ACQ4PT_053439 [Festuca glaucescens]